jgi:uncharacterized membrane protein
MVLKKKEAIIYGWEQTKSNFWVIVGTFTASIALPAALENLVKDGQNNPILLLQLLSFLLSMLFACGMTKFALNILHKKQVSGTLLYTEHKYFLHVTLGTILNSIAVGVGLLLLLVPGIIVGLKLSMFKYFIVEKGMNATTALKASWELTNGHVWELFVFALLRIGVMILGALALGIGVLVALPVIELAKVDMYKQLQNADTKVQRHTGA